MHTAKQNLKKKTTYLSAQGFACKIWCTKMFIVNVIIIIYYDVNVSETYAGKKVREPIENQQNVTHNGTSSGMGLCAKRKEEKRYNIELSGPKGCG